MAPMPLFSFFITVGRLVWSTLHSRTWTEQTCNPSAMDYYEDYDDYDEGLAVLEHLVANGHFRGDPEGREYLEDLVAVGILNSDAISDGSSEHEDSEEHEDEQEGSVHEDDEEQPVLPSQDADFQSQVDVVVLPKLQGRNSVPEPRPKNVETEESTCSICFEPWTNSGLHRLASIKCGHLFGESCILKWIAHRGRSGKAQCPDCKCLNSRKDVRRIWSRNVVVLDTAEKDEAIARAKKEQDLRTRSEQELKQSRMAYEMLKFEMTKLQQKHDQQRASKKR